MPDPPLHIAGDIALDLPETPLFSSSLVSGWSFEMGLGLFLLTTTHFEHHRLHAAVPGRGHPRKVDASNPVRRVFGSHLPHHALGLNPAR